MAGSLNKAVILGHVGKDPDIRTTQQGKKIANLTVATSESWTDKQTGERKEKTEWHRVVIMSEPLANLVEQRVRKGSKIYVSGQLQTRKWTDNSGVERYSTEIILSGFKSDIIFLDKSEASSDTSRQDYSSRQSSTSQQEKPSEPDDIDDEIPF